MNTSLAIATIAAMVVVGIIIYISFLGDKENIDNDEEDSDDGSYNY